MKECQLLLSFWNDNQSWQFPENNRVFCERTWPPTKPNYIQLMLKLKLHISWAPSTLSHSLQNIMEYSRHLTTCSRRFWILWSFPTPHSTAPLPLTIYPHYVLPHVFAWFMNPGSSCMKECPWRSLMCSPERCKLAVKGQEERQEGIQLRRWGGGAVLVWIGQHSVSECSLSLDQLPLGCKWCLLTCGPKFYASM